MYCETMPPLTETERVFAENNLRLVFEFLHKNHLPQEDWFDVIVFGFLSAVHDFHAKKTAQQFAFSTIAFRQMKYSVRQEYEYQNAVKRPQNVQSLDAVLTGCEDRPFALLSTIEDRHQNVVEKVENTERIRKALDLLDTQHENVKRAVIMHMAGYSRTEISECCHLAKSTVSWHIYRFQKKLREAGI